MGAMPRRVIISLSLAGVLLLSACAPPRTPTPIIVVVQRTPAPTWTLPFNPNATPVPGAPDTATAIPSDAPPPGTLTPSPTARPGIDPTLGASTPDPLATHSLPIPEPMPQLFLDPEIFNVLLLGRDTDRATRSYRTDVMIVVSINKRANSVTLLTMPRDLYVYIPGWTMNRLNTAANRGDAIGYPGGGIALLQQTILYNLGIPIHGYAMIDFNGFKQVVDILGGVDVPVSCAMQDWRLKDPGLDPQNADNWELFTVETGLQHMNGDYALWYARSRKRSSDFDRSRRQHQVLRAMLDQGLRLDMLPRAPELYASYIEIVSTDMGLGDVLQFVPMAAGIDRTRIKSRFIGSDQVWRWTTPQGAAVLLPDRDAIGRLLAEAFEPPPENVLARDAPSVEIWNGTTRADSTALAVDNLNWAGVRPVIGQADSTGYATTTLYDYSTSAKTSVRAQLQRVFNIADANVIASPDPNAPNPYRIVLGADYDACVKPIHAIRPTPTPGPGNGDRRSLTDAEVVHAARVLEPPPRIDGDLQEWTFLVYPVKEPTLGAGNWRGPEDLSASWNIAWDDRYLYVALRVIDDVKVQAAAGENLFRGDSLEIWLNTDLTRDSPALDGRHFQVGLSPGDFLGAPGQAYRWLPQAKKNAVLDAVIAMRPTERGYDLEVAIPWTVFELTPFANEGLGFVLALNDDDTPGAADQETHLAHLKDVRLAQPNTWGVLVLDPPPGP